VKDVRLHDLRHAWARTQVAAGANPASVSEALGHTSASFTMTTYYRGDAETAASLAANADAAIGGALGSVPV
jgi:integrase